VAWFCRAAGAQPTTDTTVYNLYRRQLLVVGYAGQAPFSTNANNAAAVTSLWQASQSGQSRPTQLYDLSLRLEGGLAVPNSLGDLTKRENRCFLSGTGSLRTGTFPYAFLIDGDRRALADATFDSTDRVWEDVVLTNVISFDVRVFDPTAKAQPTTTPSLLPGDPGYNSQAAASGAGAAGAYVDLGWGGGSPTLISGTFPPVGQTALQSAGRYVRNSASNNISPIATYDTWSFHYEVNGEDEDGDGVVDDGTNGVDDNGDDLPDNPPEYETSPPYPVPLKGIEVRIRCYEPTSKQVRQITLRHAFTKD
jgi:hypothetical protein